MWAYLWRDPVMRVTLVLAAAVFLPHFIPLLSRDALAYYAELYSDVPLILVAMAAFQYRLRCVPDKIERRFWNLLTAAFACWLLVRIIGIVFPVDWYVDIRAGLTIDLLYVCFYLSIALALELQPHSRADETVDKLLRSFRSTGAIVFVFGLLTYFAVIPGALHASAYDTWVPSLLLFVALDGYLLVRLMSLRRASRSPRWNRTYSWLLLAAGVWMVMDAYEALSYIEPAIWVDPGTLLDLVWLPPFLAVVAAARARESDLASGASAATVARDVAGDMLSALWGTPLVAYVVALPALHFGLYGLGVLDESTKSAREICVLVVLVVLALVAWVHQRLLDAERRRLEKVSAEAQVQLEHAQRMGAIGQLTAGIAHDFNNLLTVILANASLLREVPAISGKPLTELDEIEASSRRGAALVQQLLAFAQRRRLNRTEVELAPLLDDLVPTLQRLLPENIEISVSSDGALLPVKVDPGTVEQIVVNLATNARDAMPQGGLLRIECRRAPPPPARGGDGSAALARDFVCISVTDTGTGMDERTRARIFEPFFTTKPVGEGSGLGMSMVYGLVTQQGGFVEIESEVGRGTEVMVYLPAAPGVADGATD